MSKPKPKSALAKLLDSGVSMQKNIGGGEVGIALTEEAISSQHHQAAEYQINPKDKQLELLFIDANICRPWQYADRPEDEMGDIEGLAESINCHGQQEPILLRPINSRDSSIKYEVIFGNRRWRACKMIDKKVLAIVKAISDQEAALYQKEENENRKDLSDLARARSYKAQIEVGIFKNESELSKMLGISPQNLNDIMSFNRIPIELASAIPNLKEISTRTAVKLAAIASKNKNNMELLIKLAPKVGTKEVTSVNIDKWLEKFSGLTKEVKTPINIEEIYDQRGRRAFIIRKSENGEVTIKIDKKLQYDIEGLKTVIREYMERSQ